MEVPKIFDSEYRFACIVWDHEPVTTRELVELCRKKLEWKRTTTYTVLRRLCDRGIMKTENSVVTSRVSRQAVQGQESRQFVERTFQGSLPQFVAAFLRSGPLSREEAEQLRRLIDQAGGEEQ